MATWCKIRFTEKMEEETELMLTTREEIIKACATNPEGIADLLLFLLKENAELKLRVKALEDQLNKNSRNSSKPPSSDGLRKPVPKSMREKGQKPQGGQAGHPGSTLRMVDQPNHVVVHPLNVCSCGCNLAHQSVDHTAKRQVWEIPPLQLEVTEHRVEYKYCPQCQRLVQAAFPEEVSAPVQYGSGLMSLGVYMNNYQFIPYARICEMMIDLFGHSPSESSWVNANRALYEQLAETETEIKARILATPVVHFDETGMRVEGKTQWCHVASTPLYTHYTIHPKRGKEAMIASGVLPTYSGVALHDAWAPYWHFEACFHALCNAHILRELIFLSEQDHRQWAKGMIKLLLAAKKALEAATQTGSSLPVEELNFYLAWYDRVLEVGFAEELRLESTVLAEVPEKKRGKIAQSKSKNLLDRLQTHRLSVLAFLFDPDVPFDNNLAERDERMNKVKQKVSGCFRSQNGASMYARIRGYVSTMKKNAVPILDALHRALIGNALLPSPT